MADRLSSLTHDAALGRSTDLTGERRVLAVAEMRHGFTPANFTLSITNPVGAAVPARSSNYCMGASVDATFAAVHEEQTATSLINGQEQQSIPG